MVKKIIFLTVCIFYFFKSQGQSVDFSELASYATATKVQIEFIMKMKEFNLLPMNETFDIYRNKSNPTELLSFSYSGTNVNWVKYSLTSGRHFHELLDNVKLLVERKTLENKTDQITEKYETSKYKIEFTAMNGPIIMYFVTMTPKK